MRSLVILLVLGLTATAVHAGQARKNAPVAQKPARPAPVKKSEKKPGRPKTGRHLMWYFEGHTPTWNPTHTDHCRCPRGSVVP